VGEHAPELEAFHEPREAAHVRLDAFERGVVRFPLREREELARVGEAGIDLLDRGEGFLEDAAFLAEVLRLLRVVPDLRVLERADDFDQPRLLRVVVKDTSGAPPCGRRGPGGSSG
jgi:hypothetical protein